MAAVLEDEPRVAGAVGSAGAGEVAEAFAAANVATARAHALLARLSTDDVFVDDASVSAAAWLRSRVGLSAAEAGRAVGTADLLRSAPVLCATWQTGRLSAGQVAAVRANVDAATQPLFAEQEADVVPVLVPLTVRETVRAMRAWKAYADALVERPEPPELGLGRVHLRQQLDGSWHLRATLSAEAGAVVDEALCSAATRTDAVGDPPTSAPERHAEALLAVCERFLRNAPLVRRRRRPHVHVVVDAAAVVDGGRGRLGGATLPSSATERLLCDAELHRIVLGPAGEVLDHGRAHRVVPAGLWTAVALRDQGCRHPGCDRPEDWCDAHHIVPFGRGGPTASANLVLLCRRHHTLAHRAGWSQRLTDDGDYEVTDPHGRTRRGGSPGPAPPGHGP